MRLKNKTDHASIGIIGGTGSDIELESLEEIKVYTPYGSPSDLIQLGTFHGKKVAFISRHGKGHTIPPHKLNFRANIWALKELGVKCIISPSAVGSLKKEHDKGKFVLVNQYIDRTKKRLDTFFEGGQVCHIGQPDPYCSYLNDQFYEVGKQLNLNIQNGGTYVCIEGPRFSTRSESKMFRLWGGDIIGMTTYPEVVLAAEKELCYCCIATITDLDVWAGECPQCGIVEYGEKCEKCGGPVTRLAVDVSEILETMEQNAENLKKLLQRTIPKLDLEKDCPCHHSLEGAIL
ncbi:MAG: S-methyl-5'-thioadenosine phosphorylase [Candidatus Lokiarchaeota archaeon]|nr:S-methyl-5'-thioadenosine phosphorylase [Candidatus Lokiarchaeota archaeon]MBD3199774.1 S-methyl-5'-thioadenosine phosphorylase [Candidatus Lokiarchaeota archaeon]